MPITLLCVLSAMVDVSTARGEEERCYPGPPMFILRELMGGVESPQRYREAILVYANERCRNGQTLKLVSPAGPDEKDKLNDRIAEELCERETIYRETLAPGERAIVVFCLVSKLAEPASTR